MVPAPPDRESSVAESSCIVLSLSVPGHRDRFLVDIDHACVYNKERPVVFIITGEPGGGKPIRRAWWGQADQESLVGASPTTTFPESQGKPIKCSGGACRQCISKKKPSRFVILSGSEGSLSGERSCAALRMTLLHRLRLTRKSPSLKCSGACPRKVI